MRRLLEIALIAAASLLVGAGAVIAADDGPADGRLGGELTVVSRTSRAYGLPGPTLDADSLARFARGDGDFDATFVSGASPVNSGLGPKFNNASCRACHVGDGRGLPVLGNGPRRSMALVRVSASSGGEVDGIGYQVRDHATFGAQADARVEVSWQARTGSYGDGTPFEVREPVIEITFTDGSRLSPDVLTSLRVAPPVVGRGLLEAVPEEAILALADPDDANGDGISGRPNWAATSLGRFGLKATVPTLLEQNASAYVRDMGVSNPLFPEPDGTFEVDRATLEDVTFYVRTLAVPAQRMSPDAQRGRLLYATAGCASCHVPSLRTGPSDIPALSNQVIYPYSDLLLHDLGPDLADGRPDLDASGSEWRTPPLCGLGLTETVLGGNGAYLHDGRARSLDEAILWHGGEAEVAREWFRTTASAEDRRALLAFLRSL